jgi:16S rRNA (guanine966-N2)-methyltransferase
MENRRPPHPKSSSGRYFDRNRGNTSFRGGSGGEGSGRPTRRENKPGDGRYHDRSGGGPQRRDAGLRRDDGRSVGPRGRPGYKPGDNRQRGRPGDRARVENEIKIVSDAQITDGKFRGRTLLNSVSPNTVPTKRKVREVVFKILSRRVKAGRILDLGAACGTIGIEAISRGAMLVTFVDRSARMCTYIRKNLSELGIKDGHGEVVEMEALPYLIRTARRRRTWDIVYLDLPEGDARAAVLEHLSRSPTIVPSGLLIIPHSSASTYPDKISRLTRWRKVDQGETILSIYERI